jgi:hypothetical protein
MIKIAAIVLKAFLALGLFYPVTTKNNIYEADVVIYGGNSAAIIAAVQVARSGLKVIVVSPDRHIGGLSSGGLGFTDTGNKEVIGGLARDFYHRVWLHYNSPDSAAWKWQMKADYGNKGQGTAAIDGVNRTMWIFEPHVAEKIFDDYVTENNIVLFRNEWLDRKSGVTLHNRKITSIRTLTGKTFEGKVFIDATYEGDLMAAAGVPYTIGRESCAVYGEQWNGVQANVFHHGHYFKSKIDPYIKQGDPSSGVLPYISNTPIQPNCSGDHKIQAYCFRLCMSNHPVNRIAFKRPKSYDPKNYELLARLFESGWNEWFAKFDAIPNRKTDTNNHGPFSTDYIGMNYDYPEASYAQRLKIIEDHKNYQEGLLYFVSTDPRVPESVRTKMKNWGLAKDEFTDNDHWPHQLYIREARRMIGQYVTTENDVLGKRPVPAPIGMGSYTMDSHNVQRYITDQGYVQNEGDVGVHPARPYQIAYGSIIPKKEDCRNLLVPVCLSSSHIAYGSIRMEPVFMILGQSAATAAVLAVTSHSNVQDISMEELNNALIAQKQILRLDQVNQK